MNRISDFRINVLQLTQKEFADAIGVSKYAVWKWENGKGRIAIKNRRAITDYAISKRKFSKDELEKQLNLIFNLDK